LERPKEQRLDSRFHCAGSALAYFVPCDPPFTSTIIDLSVRGGLIVLDKPRITSMGTTLELGFTVNQLVFRVRAQVRSVRSPTTLGLVFDNVHKRVKPYLEDLVEELAADNQKRRAHKRLMTKQRRWGF
jgi:hypothetical protein